MEPAPTNECFEPSKHAVPCHRTQPVPTLPAKIVCQGLDRFLLLLVQPEGLLHVWEGERGDAKTLEVNLLVAIDLLRVQDTRQRLVGLLPVLAPQLLIRLVPCFLAEVEGEFFDLLS